MSDYSDTSCKDCGKDIGEAPTVDCPALYQPLCKECFAKRLEHGCYVPQQNAIEMMERLNKAGFGKVGTTNTLWGMVFAACERVEKLEKLASFAGHKAGCPKLKHHGSMGPATNCTCGYNDLLFCERNLQEGHQPKSQVTLKPIDAGTPPTGGSGAAPKPPKPGEEI